jgi:hypothetical protein
MKTGQKLAQRQIVSNDHNISVCLTGNVGYISITDNGLYPDEDSRSHRRDLNFHTMMVPLMTREELKNLHTAIGEVLKNSR